jgi:hypothetical protein
MRIRVLSLRARLLLVALLAGLVPACWSLAADETNQCATGYGGGDEGFGGGGFGGGAGFGGGDFGTSVGGSVGTSFGTDVASSSADVSGAGPSSGAAGGGFGTRPVPHRVRRRHRRDGIGTAQEAICPGPGTNPDKEACIENYANCQLKRWVGPCSDCLHKCITQGEWDFQMCHPPVKCPKGVNCSG